MILASQIGWFAGSGLAIYFFRSGAGSAPWIIRWDLALILGSLVIVALLLPSIGEVLGEPSNPAGAATLGWGSRGREELRALYADTALRRVGLATLFLVGGNWIFMSTSSVYLVNQLRVPREWIGRVSLIGTVITSALLPFLGPLCDRRGPAAAIRVAAMGYFGCYVALFLWPTLPMAVIVFGAPAYALLLIGLASAASEIGGVARRGGGIGIVDGVWAVAVALGSALGGVLADFRLSWIPAVTLAVVTVGVVIAWSAASRLDRRLAE
jgi:Na+/melibiose symporter-like transporter